MPASFKKALTFIFVLCLADISWPSQKRPDVRSLVDTSEPLGWTQGYTLILIKESDPLSVNEVREFIAGEGGTIAVCANGHAMLGWIPPGTAARIVGKHGVESIHYEPIDPEALKYQDEITQSFVRFFDTVASGEAEQRSRTPRQAGDPLINDVREHPFVDPGDVLANLTDKHVSWDDELARTAKNAGIFPGYSDSMTGTIAYALFFVESDGTIDSNAYSWTTAARDLVVNQVLSGASWWSNKASYYNNTASFYITTYFPDNAVVRQGYEPILHTSGDDFLWISKIMQNLGYFSGSALSQVTSFNAWLKDNADAQWAYSCFIAYNPSGAPTTFTDGYFAFAYLGGPFIQMLYRNDGWSTSDIWRVFAHESGHIFWACDEYYQAGYGGCTNCAPCSPLSPRQIPNGNCEHPSCKGSAAVACMMRANSDALCSYTVSQVGWDIPQQTLTIQAGTGGTTNPAPGSYTYDKGSRISVRATANANYRFKDWSGDASGTSNPVTVLVDRDETVMANFLRQYALTIQAGAGGTTQPAPGKPKYDEGTSAQVTASPNDTYYFTGWSGAGTGRTNPISILMNGDKTLTANFKLIEPPANFTGQKVLNRSLARAEYINVLTWAANPNNENITGYTLYLVEGGQRTEAHSFDAATFRWQQRNVARDREYTYQIVAVNDESREGAPATVVLK